MQQNTNSAPEKVMGELCDSSLLKLFSICKDVKMKHVLRSISGKVKSILHIVLISGTFDGKCLVFFDVDHHAESHCSLCGLRHTTQHNMELKTRMKSCQSSH